MPNDFLHKEYELCYQQLRFYDERQVNLLKYLFTLTSTVATALFALYKAFSTNISVFYAALVILGMIVFVSSLLLFLAMLQNRLYFVFHARQLNAIRAFFLETESAAFDNNQLYTRTDIAAAKPLSTHTFTLLGAGLLVAIYAGIVTIGIGAVISHTIKIVPAVIVFGLMTLLLLIGGYRYLLGQSEKSADHAVHGLQKKKKTNNS